jgi:antitoxin HicB
MNNLDDYPFEIRPLKADEGGGYLISYPDFSECISDGETVEEVIANGREALVETIQALTAFGHPVPEPGSGGRSRANSSRASRRACTQRFPFAPNMKASRSTRWC